MNRDNVRSLGVFLAVVLVLMALVLGGVYFAKTRSANYARPSQPWVTTNNQNDTSSQQNQPAPQSTPPAPQPQSQQQQSEPANVQPQAAQPQPASQASKPAATPTPTEQVPATGPTDFFFVAALITVAIYSLISLRRTRLAMRRLLS